MPSPPGLIPGDESMMLRVTTPVCYCFTAAILTSTAGLTYPDYTLAQ